MKAIMYVNVENLPKLKAEAYMAKYLEEAKAWYPQCDFLAIAIRNGDTRVEFVKESENEPTKN